ncbi:MAG: SsrA-binding protein, partial [Bacteroidaceae bacterium]
MTQFKTKINIKNRKAAFEYFFISRYNAGIVLSGTEIKSIRLGKASLVDTYCYIHNHEIWIKNMYIAPYSFGSFNNHS